jgi:ferredoxin
MTYVVTGNCQRCRFTDCVTACPVDAFRAADDMLYISPDDCIDCGACESACPVKAIYEDRKLQKKPELLHWIEVNAQNAGLPMINKKQAPLPTAEERKKELGL